MQTALDDFLAHVEARGLSLYPAQEEAILEVFAGNHVILQTPTGSGKSLVALAVHFRALAQKERSFYTAPIKALVSEKFFDLCAALGPENVGMMTGDASVNVEASVVCCTAEILAQLALRDGEAARIDSVVMDEFHYYGDPDRGIAWQVPLLELPQAAFVLMSATLGDMSFFVDDLKSRSGREVALVQSDERPVPLSFGYAETPLHETLSDLREANQLPVYMVHFSQRAASERAQSLMSIDLLTKPEKAAIKAELAGFRFDSPFGKDLRRFVHHGVGVHHAGLLPKYRRMVERLAQAGHLKVISGTDTLGVGVNVPIRTVLFTQLCKYDGRSTAVLSVRDFQQIAGRAGRKGFDERGFVVAQAPEHVIENLAQERRAAGDAKKLRKLVRKKPPERGYAHWDEATFKRLAEGTPEALQSHFVVTHGLLLQLLQRDEGCRAIPALIRKSHETPRSQRHQGRIAIQLLRSLLELGVVSREAEGLVLSDDLQEDFSLHQMLSLWVVETLPLLDPSSPDYALDVVTLVEAVLENPTPVLRKQLDKLKKETVEQLKAEGVEYDRRMEILEGLEHPKPLRDFVYERYNDFAAHHPWVGENIRPKSVVRNMFEEALGFRDYVKEYGLLRSEGVLLRYLSDAYTTLLRTVPDGHKSEEVQEVIDWLGSLVRGVDASLLAEWEQMMNPEAVPVREIDTSEGADVADPAAADITRQKGTFTKLVRNASFRLLRAAARQRWSEFRGQIANPNSWREAQLAAAFEDYFEEHGSLRTDQEARSPSRIDIDLEAGRVEQTLLDPEAFADWRMKLRIDLAASQQVQQPVLHLVAVGTALDWPDDLA